MSKPNEGFFSVSLNRFESITEDLSMNECCLYLIYCCGTAQLGKSPSTSNATCPSVYTKAVTIITESISSQIPAITILVIGTRPDA